MTTYQRDPALTAQTYIQMIAYAMADKPCAAITITLPRDFTPAVIAAYRNSHRFMFDSARRPSHVKLTVYTVVPDGAAP